MLAHGASFFSCPSLRTTFSVKIIWIYLLTEEKFYLMSELLKEIGDIEIDVPRNSDNQNTVSVTRSPCNACGGEHFSVMGHRSDGLRVFRCITCGLGTVEKIPARLETYYDNSYYGTDKTGNEVGYRDYASTAEHGVSWAAALVPLLKSEGRILDIGCVDGTLLAKLPHRFERYGIEVNDQMAIRAAEAGVRLIGRDLLDPTVLDENRRSFDVVTSIAVFEHLSDFRRGLQVSLDLLKPDGVLLFEVPYISAEHENRLWYESSLEHVFYPSGDALRWLVEDLGAYLVGGEVYIRDYASNYIGIAFHDPEMVNEIQALFNALTSTDGIPPIPEQRQARQQLMLIHAAESTPDLLEGLDALLASGPPPALMRRLVQLWGNDLRRLVAARQEIERLAGELSGERQRLAAELAAARRARDRLAKKVTAAQVQIKELQTQLHQMIGSTSWKVTYPLRRLVSVSRSPRAVRLMRQMAKLLWWSIRLELPSRLREVRDRRQAAARSIPPLSFLPQSGILSPLGEDDELEPWPDDRPLVSIIIPCFNYGRFVAEAVDSALAQTLTNLEVIVVEGGSTDAESREHTLNLVRPRTRVIAQEKPHPVGANRNLGISHARGKYICCLDADDLLAPTYIEKAVFLLEAYRYDVVSCGLQFFGDRDERVGIMETPTLADMLDGNHILTCGVFRRSLWRRVGGFQDTERAITGHIHEDWLYWARLAAQGARMYNMAHDYLFLYRRHGTATLSSQARSIEQHRQLIRQALGELAGPKAISHSRRMAVDLRMLQGVPRHPVVASDRRPVLLLALPFLIIGGAERLLSRIVAHLAAQGWRVLILTSVDPGEGCGETTGWFESATREIYHLPRFLGPERWRDFVRYLVASRQANVLWIVGSAFIYEMLPDLRVEFPEMRVADLLFNTVGHTANNRKHAGLIDITFVENQEVLQFLRDAGEVEARIALVPSGVDLQTYQPGPRAPEVTGAIEIMPNDVIIGFSGRWSAEKNPLAFVEIARQSLHLPVRFVMTGAGPMRHEIEAALDSAMLPEGYFHLIGEVEDVLPWLRSYDVLVLPSLLDGRPVVVMEALALGVPVLASRVGALPELVEDGVTGFLCSPEKVEEFVENLSRLVLDRALLACMKTAARTSAEQNLDIRAMLSRYEERLHILTQSDIGKATADTL